MVRHGPAALLGKRWREVGDLAAPFDPVVAGLGTDGGDLPERIRVRRLIDNKPYLVAAPTGHSGGHGRLTDCGLVALVARAAAFGAFARPVDVVLVTGAPPAAATPDHAGTRDRDPTALRLAARGGGLSGRMQRSRSGGTS